MKQLTEQLKEYGTVEEYVSMKDLTTLRVGGKARWVVHPSDVFCLQSVVRILQEKAIPYKIFGNGSNLLCSDKDYDGAIIKLSRNLNQLFVDGTTVTAQAGVSSVALSYQMMRRGLSGLEFASGIPGTVGGGIYMNAGAYKSSFSAVVRDVQVLIDGRTVWLKKEECGFDYRTSVFQQHPDWIILAARMDLVPGDPQAIEALMKDRQQRRFASQPLNMPSAGSFFRNRPEQFAWQYIDAIGYRGKCYGDACVSAKHSNFIVNTGEARAEDVERLIDDIQRLVKERYGVDLILEVERFNW
jgi:UDP-N-acetylmuramate dehydrogenase